MKFLPHLLFTLVFLGGLAQCAQRAAVNQYYYDSMEQSQQQSQWMQQQIQVQDQQNQQMVQQMMNEMNQMNGGYPGGMSGMPGMQGGAMPQGYPPNGGFRSTEPDTVIEIRD